MGSSKRIRAHTNPLNLVPYEVPLKPDEYNWSNHFYDEGEKEVNDMKLINFQPDFADIGCGFGDLLIALSPLFPTKKIIGVEIRKKAVEVVQKKIEKYRKENDNYNNIGVIEMNIMKSAQYFFNKSSLEKMFFLFGDPHFKNSNHRRRVINDTHLAIYAYILKIGGLLYTITDVYDYHLWMCKYLDKHPLFKRIPLEELKDDICMHHIANSTAEGQKVSRLNGNKYPAVYVRIKDQNYE